MAKGKAKVVFSPSDTTGLLNTLTTESVRNEAARHYATAMLARLVSALEQGQTVTFEVRKAA